MTQINQMKKDATDKAVDTAFILMLGIPTLVIHDKYPSLMRKEVDGKGREERFVDMCLDLYDSFNRGDVSLDDIAMVLKDECNLIIEKRR